MAEHPEPATVAKAPSELPVNRISAPLMPSTRWLWLAIVLMIGIGTVVGWLLLPVGSCC